MSSSNNSKPRNSNNQQQQPKQQQATTKQNQPIQKKGWNTPSNTTYSINNGGNPLSTTTSPPVRGNPGTTSSGTTTVGIAATTNTTTGTPGGTTTSTSVPAAGGAPRVVTPANSNKQVMATGGNNYAAALKQQTSAGASATASNATSSSVVKSTSATNSGTPSKPTPPASVWGAPLPPGILGAPAPTQAAKPPVTNVADAASSLSAAVANAGLPETPATNAKKTEKSWQNPEAPNVSSTAPVATTGSIAYVTDSKPSSTMPAVLAPSSLVAAVMQQQQEPPLRPSPTPGNISPLISSSPTPNMQQQYPFSNMQQQQQMAYMQQRLPPTWQPGNQPFHSQQPTQMPQYYTQHIMHPQHPNHYPYTHHGAANTQQYPYHMGGMVPHQQQPPPYHGMPYATTGMMRPAATNLQKQGATPPTSGNGTFMPATTTAPAPRKKKISLITDKFGNPIEIPKPSSSLAAAVAATKAPAATATPEDAATPAAAPSEAPAPTLSLEPTASTQQQPQPQQSEQEKTKQSEDAGAKLRAAAEMAIKSDRKAEEEKAARIELEKKKEAERLEEEMESKRLEEEEAIRKLREAEEEKERIRKENERKEQEEEDSRKKAAANLSLMQAKLESRKQEAKAQTIAAEQIVSAPVTAASTPSLRPSAGSLRPGGLRPSQGSPPMPVAAAPVITTGLRPGGGNRFIPDTPTATTPTTGVKRITYSKEEMLSFKDCAACTIRPSDLPDLPIISTASGQSSRMGGGDTRGVGPSRGPSVTAGATQWSRGSQQQSTTSSSGATGVRRQSSGGGDSWSRGKELPQPPPERPGRGGGRGAGGRGGRGGRQDDERYDQGPPLLEDPVKPIERTSNRWRPTKDTSVLAATEKKVKGILNKMTKTNYERLSQQICDITIPSNDVLSMIINRVFEKAIDEPSFGDTYADLCVRLSKSVNPDSFLHFMEEKKGDDTASHRWSSNIGTSDSEIFGPFVSETECVDAAFLEDPEALRPISRGDIDLTLVKPMIIDGIFIKIMKQTQVDADKEALPNFFAVFFPVEDAEACGQQLSESFETEDLCRKDARKMNSSKRCLLNKCEDEFKKQDIYVDWKREKKDYEAKKASLTEAECNEIQEVLEMKRIKIKKQMLGNIRFIGELFKKRLIKASIMHECILSLMKLQKAANGGLEQAEDDEMDEEDHEALCQLFNTVGEEIDRNSKDRQIELYFDRIEVLSNDNALASRSRFMYKDLIELRQNGWQARRKQETAKTLEEIRKDAAREEYLTQQQQQQQQGREPFRSSDRREPANRPGFVDNRNVDPRKNIGGQAVSRGQQVGRQNLPTPESSKRFTQAKSAVQPDGFTQILVRGPNALPPSSLRPTHSEPKISSPKALDPEKLKSRIGGIRAEFLNDQQNEAELLASVDGLSGTPGLEATLVLVNCEWALECKASERQGVIKMLLILLKNEKILREHIEGAFSEQIEFIDDTKVDIPTVYDVMGELLGELLSFNTLSLSWVCTECAKIPLEKSRAELIQKIMNYAEKAKGPNSCASIFRANEGALITLLGSEKWGSIKPY